MSSTYRRARPKAKIIDLDKTAHKDEKFFEDDDEDSAYGEGTDDEGAADDFDKKESDLFETQGRKERSLLSTWKDAGAKKDKVLQTLISKFAMLIHKNDEDEVDAAMRINYQSTSDDFVSEDLPVDALYSKLPSTTKALIKIIEYVARYAPDCNTTL